MLIGYMHHRKSPVKSNRAYAFAAAAKAEGAELLYFSPLAADTRNRTINGYIYRNGEWEKTASRYPDVIYNTAGFTNEKQIKIAEELSREIPFTSYSVGSKMNVFENLRRYKTFSEYLVPSETVRSAKHFFAFSDKQLILKPVWGRQGVNVYHISRNGGMFLIQPGGMEYGIPEMTAFLSDKIGEYIVQPYINCRTKSGTPYDLRLHVQKDGKGEWAVSNICPRISANGGIVCNLSQGAYAAELTKFLKNEFGGDYYDIKKYIEMFSLQLAAHLDEIQKERYGEELDELGIDIGLDENRKIRIYEVNWRPGHPPFVNIDLTVVKNAVRYAMFLADRGNNK